MANLDRATFVAPTLKQRPRLSARVFQPPMRGSLPVDRIIQELCHPEIRNPNSRKCRADVSHNVECPQSGNMNKKYQTNTKNNKHDLPLGAKNQTIGGCPRCVAKHGKFSNFQAQFHEAPVAGLISPVRT